MKVKPLMQPHADSQKMKFWRFWTLDSNVWGVSKAGNISYKVRIDERKGRVNGGRRERRRQLVWCELPLCSGKTTLAQAQGFLLLKPSDLLPPSVSLPSPSCVFRPAMKHSDGVSTLCLMFPLTHTLSVNSGGIFPPWYWARKGAPGLFTFEYRSIDWGKVCCRTSQVVQRLSN